jgi:SAM-dependent methyltransferase
VSRVTDSQYLQRDEKLPGLVKMAGRLARSPRLIPFALRHRRSDDIMQRWEELQVQRPEWARLRATVVGKSEKEFRFNGRQYPYFYHDRSTAWFSERTVEIPIAHQFLMDHGSIRRGLEVGNVLGNYLPPSPNMTIVDRYEKHPGVLNVDIEQFAPEAPFDLIVSVSTIEHVGWDELPRDPHKSPRVLRKLASLLTPGGEMLVTHPLGYHPELDQVRPDELGVPLQRYFLQRVSTDNRWVQRESLDPATVPYQPWKRYTALPRMPPFPYANGICVWMTPASDHRSTRSSSTLPWRESPANPPIVAPG